MAMASIFWFDVDIALERIEFDALIFCSWIWHVEDGLCYGAARVQCSWL